MTDMDRQQLRFTFLGDPDEPPERGWIIAAVAVLIVALVAILCDGGRV